MKSLTDMDFIEIDMNDLVESLKKNIKEDIKNFDDLVNLDSAAKRDIFIGNICVGLGTTVDDYIKFWNYMDDKNKIPVEDRKPIKLVIDSNGGSLTDTFTIIDSIAMSKTPVHTIVIGCAYSGGFFISIAGHKRFAYPHASFMMHEGATQTGGDSHKFRNYAEFYSKEMDQLKDHVLSKTSITEEKYEAIKRDDFWLTSDEAIEYGVIDEISKGF